MTKPPDYTGRDRAIAAHATLRVFHVLLQPQHAHYTISMPPFTCSVAPVM